MMKIYGLLLLAAVIRLLQIDLKNYTLNRNIKELKKI